MNNIEFNNGLLLSPSVMENIQGDWQECINGIAKMYGNCILYGCVSNGTTITDGAIVLNGEIIKFVGGDSYSTFNVTETTRYGTFKSGSQEIGYSKTAQCAANGAYSLSAFPRIKKAFERSGEGTSWSLIEPLQGKATNTNSVKRALLGFSTSNTLSYFSVLGGKLIISCCFDVSVSTSQMNEPFAQIDVSGLNLTHDVVFTATCWKQVTENDHYTTQEFFVLNTSGKIKKLMTTHTSMTAPYVMYTTATVIDLD